MMLPSMAVTLVMSLEQVVLNPMRSDRSRGEGWCAMPVMVRAGQWDRCITVTQGALL